MNTKFSFKSGKYLKDSSNNSSLDYDKRCKHINYLINLTISKITSLNNNVGIKVVWSQKIKECRDKFFRSNPWLNCNENNKYDKNMEILGVRESSNGSSYNAIGSVSLPILGVLFLSFFLYKYTPLGSRFNTYFRSRLYVPINQDYEETEQMLSNTSNLNDMDSEIMQYNLSYETL
ncbi:PIR Superfamily Protein [Plasmodium ovale curtisi]|uniref:PIR Superfamily Protein n=2 Tax=Plasmodium ovale curtisi TaxID=864141 RepID=A0A1A8WKG1_PLAOA|nr:PIR Superfamily Protein [Plasmodium ovale curtisi]